MAKSIKEITEDRKKIKEAFISGKIMSKEAVRLLKENDAEMKEARRAKRK